MKENWTCVTKWFAAHTLYLCFQERLLVHTIPEDENCIFQVETESQQSAAYTVTGSQDPGVLNLKNGKDFWKWPLFYPPHPITSKWTEWIRQSKSLSSNCTIKSQPTFHLDGSLVMPLITGDWCNNSWPAFSKQLHNMQTPPVALQKWIPTTY